MEFSVIRRGIFGVPVILGLLCGAPPLVAQGGQGDQGDGASFITFQVPDLLSQAFPFSINLSGSVTGFADYHAQLAGFVRDSGGTVTPFFACGFRSWPISINVQGTIVGYCETGVFLGFVRSPQGTVQTIECPPPAVPPQFADTLAFDVNANGDVVGSCATPAGAPGLHGFVRSQDGTFTLFDVPGSSATWAFRIRASGDTAGVYFDTNNVEHGFLRRSNGDFTLFDLPGPIPNFGPFNSPPSFYLNEPGDISGTYLDSSHTAHGFARSKQGTIVTFDVPGSSSTSAQGLNAEGTITGSYSDTKGSHGFVRSRQGNFTSFDVPGSSNTFGYGINDLGVVTGNYYSPNGTSFGYLRVPSQSDDGPGNAQQ